jgi:hypothetical protein
MWKFSVLSFLSGKIIDRSHWWRLCGDEKYHPIWALIVWKGVNHTNKLRIRAKITVTTQEPRKYKLNSLWGCLFLSDRGVHLPQDFVQALVFHRYVKCTIFPKMKSKISHIPATNTLTKIVKTIKVLIISPNLNILNHKACVLRSVITLISFFTLFLKGITSVMFRARFTIFYIRS